jgi:hypothetical protein
MLPFSVSVHQEQEGIGLSLYDPSFRGGGIFHGVLFLYISLVVSLRYDRVASHADAASNRDPHRMDATTVVRFRSGSTKDRESALSNNAREVPE